MSATNRGGIRHPADFYATPAWCVERLLERLHLRGGAWLEPGAGEGNLIRAVNRDDIRWTALELREECRPHLEMLAPVPEIIITDKFVAPGLHDSEKPLAGRRFDVAFGNPPFSLAQEFVQESLKVADTVVMLLRLDFLSSQERAPFMKSQVPDVYVIPDRPSFTGYRTDSSNYGWFVWRAADHGRPAGNLAILDRTPLEVRRRAAETARSGAESPGGGLLMRKLAS